jgi:methyl-accepting chemotaxis protein
MNEESGNRDAQQTLEDMERGSKLVDATRRLPTSDPPSVPSMKELPDVDPARWATEAVNLMAARVEQMMKLSREAWQGLANASQEMLATAKVMQAVIGEQDRTLAQLATSVQQIGIASSALVNLYQDYQTLLDELMAEASENEGQPVQTRR